ncbi:hypothetical protein BDV29DRAFT_154229 [Aspergillus leporis]|uniref:Uncharacterized protein n=1 Tax=Aspergillus leporis TaxID=41062 RepID=A0A5N5X8E1_9EURO|nr:hypothetical protein BDV29DRAFT_154229 [Aspergillus leporis]
MVVCPGGLVNFINGSANPSPFCNEASSSPQAQADEYSTAPLIVNSHAFPPPRRQWTDRPARRIGITLSGSHSGSPRAYLYALLAAPPLSPSAGIITLDTVRKSDSPFAAQISPPRFLADSCAKVCEVLEHALFYRVLVMLTAGVRDSWGNLPWLSKAFLRWDQCQAAIRRSEADGYEDGRKIAGQ